MKENDTAFMCGYNTHTLLVRLSLSVRPGAESANRACGLSVDIMLAKASVCVLFGTGLE